jgi:hypothetical protein
VFLAAANSRCGDRRKNIKFRLRISRMTKYLLIVLCIVVQLGVFGQNENKKVMTSYVPKSNAYDIYYPKNFLLNEDNEGIVTITDTIAGLNITVSSYLVDSTISDEKLIEQLIGFVKTYHKKETKRENWNSYKTKFDILVELKIADEKTNWVWYGIVDKGRMVLISMNKETTILKDEINLVQFMINNLIING